MKIVAYMFAIALSGFVSLAIAADDPIKQVDAVQPKPEAFAKATRAKPLELKSKEEAAEFFAAEQLESLLKQVDFDKQTVLVFAWKGSGQDKLSHLVAESFPEQIFFTVTPGRTRARDLRPHMQVYVLKKGVKWSVK
ncbi:hypothetical protein NA78x_004472 [Anatilimnocola sp. NA78]|uniref:hypothetical protein n=1 Tax=Anatilimnocola sp. NA78 TaxID=3415683 RepID=UPI003CE47404